MSIELWKEEIEEIKTLSQQFRSQTAKYALGDAARKLRKQIEDEENRIYSKLRSKVINGKVYDLPCGFHWHYEDCTLKAEGDVLYLIDKRNRLDKDGSYHWHHYVWIPQTDIKYAKLCVRTLGKDNYGDRYFISVDYYKHPADEYSYMSKRLDPFNRTYRPHVEYILKELDLLEAVNNNKRN